MELKGFEKIKFKFKKMDFKNLGEVIKEKNYGGKLVSFYKKIFFFTNANSSIKAEYKIQQKTPN